MNGINELTFYFHLVLFDRAERESEALCEIREGGEHKEGPEKGQCKLAITYTRNTWEYR
ncbi:hypothetical protein IRJ41_017571 [Triplophysa rosa]|uniref:Uncharacterized protein n=1 Tax=Triplophysa rosa TaxID=992332 RepID=A0A9W7TT49_TRIRA|nr:hypothetical protein IRJ41_017571 [Triplophysa rosa]